MTVPGSPLDRSQDPDRYDPDRDDPYRDADAPVEGVALTPVTREPAARLDPSSDPDRFRSEPPDRTLTELLGEGAAEEPRDTYTWAVGLLSVLLFLGLVAFLFGQVLEAG